MRWLVALTLAICAGTVQAQDPQITVEPAQEEVVVGQPYIIRVKVLVPSFMPKPPVFPTFEVPGLIVRLPERSTQPVSETVDGETWAGVQRTYRIYPMQAGVTEIPVQQISITYKDTSTNEDVPLTAEVPTTKVVATVPEGARTLDPLIIAQGIEITQSWQVAEGELAVGDAITRQLEIAVAGTSALFVPPLLEAFGPGNGDAEANPPVAGFLAYPEDAVVTETFDRGVLSGTRTEEASYIAQVGGLAEFPEIVLDWYNTKSGRVETITLEGLSVSVTIPPKTGTPIDRREARRKALLLVVVLAVGWGAYLFLWPRVRPIVLAARARYHASALAAHRVAVKEAGAQNLSGLLAALDQCAAQGHAASPEVQKALEVLTRTRYREGGKTKAEWQALLQALRRDRPALLRRGAAPTDLPRLNPFR